MTKQLYTGPVTDVLLNQVFEEISRGLEANHLEVTTFSPDHIATSWYNLRIHIVGTVRGAEHVGHILFSRYGSLPFYSSTECLGFVANLLENYQYGSLKEIIESLR